MDNILSKIPLQKTIFSITSWCQLQMASWLGVWAHFSAETRTCVGLVLAFTASMSLHMCISSIVFGDSAVSLKSFSLLAHSTGYYHMFHYYLTCHILYCSYDLIFDYWDLFECSCSLLIPLLCLLPPYVPTTISNSTFSISFSHFPQVWSFSSKYVSL